MHLDNATVDVVSLFDTGIIRSFERCNLALSRKAKWTNRRAFTLLLENSKTRTFNRRKGITGKRTAG